jgi:hypothetical protein
VKGYAVDERDEKKRPVSTAFSFNNIVAVINGEEDMRCSGEVRKSFAKGTRIGGLEEHKGHAGAKKDDISGFVFAEEFAFEVSSCVSWEVSTSCFAHILFPKRDYLHCR